MNRTLIASAAALAAVIAVPTFADEITARGSDSTMPVFKALAESFHQTSGHTIKIEGGGSSKGAAGCVAGEVQLSFLSRDLKDEEKTGGLIGVTYALDGAAIIVATSNPTTDLTVDALRDIFTGKTTEWSDGKPVVIFNRNESSGTREVFQHIVLGKEKFSDKAQVKHDGAILATVSKVPTAIAFTSAGDVNDTVKIVTVNGIAPTPDTIRNHTYPIWRPLILATKGEPSGVAKSFIEFALSPAGQKVVGANNYVPLSGGAVASGESSHNP